MKQFLLLIIALLFSLLCDSQDISFIKHKPCSFSIELPSDFNIKETNNYASPDYCDYDVQLKNGGVEIELHSMLSSRFEWGSIKELYNAALQDSTLNVTYKSLTKNYFVISGINKENGDIVYWKRVAGQNFISDMYIEYDQTEKPIIEKHISHISKSFTSD